MFVSSLPIVAGRVQATGDPDATRTVYTIVVVLLVIGVVLVGVGIWVIRQTRSDPELLAPLEQMDTRAWRKRDPAARQRMLDDVRPEGASPVRTAQEEPSVDDDFDLAEKRVPTFADLEAVAGTAAAVERGDDESASELAGVDSGADDDDVEDGVVDVGSDAEDEPADDVESGSEDAADDDVEPGSEDVADDDFELGSDDVADADVELGPDDAVADDATTDDATTDDVEAGVGEPSADDLDHPDAADDSFDGVAAEEPDVAIGDEVETVPVDAETVESDR